MLAWGRKREKLFSYKRSYHRTGAESYYGRAATCKSFLTFFLQPFYKVNCDSDAFGIPTNNRTNKCGGVDRA
jgi:hypothetical protein